MISILHLIWVLPVAVLFGMIIMALCFIAREP